MNSLHIAEKETTKPSHIVANIKDETVPIQVDNGADYSIINRDMVVKFQLNVVILENPIPLQGIKGPKFEVKECAVHSLIWGWI